MCMCAYVYGFSVRDFGRGKIYRKREEERNENKNRYGETKERRKKVYLHGPSLFVFWKWTTSFELIVTVRPEGF